MGKWSLFSYCSMTYQADTRPGGGPERYICTCYLFARTLNMRSKGVPTQVKKAISRLKQHTQLMREIKKCLNGPTLYNSLEHSLKEGINRQVPEKKQIICETIEDDQSGWLQNSIYSKEEPFVKHLGRCVIVKVYSQENFHGKEENHWQCPRTKGPIKHWKSLPNSRIRLMKTRLTCRKMLGKEVYREGKEKLMIPAYYIISQT